MFEKFDHGENTRGNGPLLALRKIRESGRNTFAFLAVPVAIVYKVKLEMKLSLSPLKGK